MKTLKQMLEIYSPKPGDEKKFFDKHKVEKNKRLGGKSTEDDATFQATNIKSVDREKEHGYNADGSDAKVYEDVVVEGARGDLRRVVQSKVGKINKGLGKMAKERGVTDMRHNAVSDKSAVAKAVKKMSDDDVASTLKIARKGVTEGSESPADYDARMRRLADMYNSMSDERKASLHRIRGRAEQFQQALAHVKKTKSSKQGVAEAAKGIPHRVKYSYDDPSGTGIASGHITLHAPDKTAAARYATSDLTKQGKKNVKVHSVSAQKQGVAEEFESVEESIEDRIEAAREKARAAGKPIKKQQPQKSMKRFVAGTSYGGSKQKDDKEDDMKEEVDHVSEGSEYTPPKLGTVEAHIMRHTTKPTVQVQVFKHDNNRGDSSWVTKYVKTFKTMDLAQAHVDRVHKQAVAEAAEQDAANESIEFLNKHKRDQYSIKNTKTGQLYHVSKYPITQKSQIYQKIKSAGGDHVYATIHKNKKPIGEAAEQVDEKKLTSAEMKKREEVARAIERENPKMAMGKKMAIATATAKKVAEQRMPKPLRQIVESMVTVHVKPHPTKPGHHVVVKSSDSSRFEPGEAIRSTELEQGQDDGYLKVKHVKG